LRRLLTLLALAALAGCAGGDDAQETTLAAAKVDRFRSVPALRPPAVTVERRARATASGSIFVTPKKGAGQDGPMIVDDRGGLIWFRPLAGGRFASDLRVQRYRGRPVLTWWEGKGAGGGGNGEYVVLGADYRELARVRSVGDFGDLHEFELTDRGTALFFEYRTVGGLVDNVIQEVDVATGELRFEWSAIEHIPRRHSYKPRTPGRPWDFAHLNSIDVDRDGDLLVSARNTHAVYKIDRSTGAIEWTLGGKASSFRIGSRARFAWAHDARRQRNGDITIFDNAAAPKTREQSRGLVLRVTGRRVRLIRAYTHPKRLLTHNQAGLQRLPNGNVFIGWGATGHFSEHGRDGRLRFDARFTDSENDSYRAYRFPWRGRPAKPPVVAVARSGARTTVYASWNGATGVARWRVLAGPSAERLAPVGTGARRGFETALGVETDQPLLAVAALDSRGRVLGTSRPIAP
jgi:outer membrane protein assembly factor BamB